MSLGAVSIRSNPGRGSSEISFSDDINRPDGGKVAEFVTHPRLHLSEARAVLRKHAKWLIYTAFPARSRYATCQKATATFGVSPDTIERIIEGDTANPCPLILGYCARIIREHTGQPTPVCRVLGQIIAGSMK